jgi:dihydrolipoamide dehydrogenase
LIFIAYHLKPFVRKMAQSYDIIVVGGGVGGYTAALRGASAGGSVALVESDLIGGTCLNVGCIPTKALLESCRLVRSAERSAEFGVGVGEVTTNPPQMVERSRSIVETMRKGVEDELERAGVSILRGRGKLLAPGKVAVTSGSSELALTAESVILATGSSWISLPGTRIDGKHIITSDHALALERTAGHMVIVGAGAVGCEFAEIYRTLGTDITIVEMMPHILPTEDEDVARRLEAALKRKGISILTASRVEGIDTSDYGVKVRISGGPVLEADRVLMAVGRKPNIAGLGLEELGVELADGGISTDDGMRTSVSGIFAAGDVTGRYLLAHVALAQGIVAGRNAAGGSLSIDYRAVPRCVYTHPEAAAVGLTEAEAVAQGLEVGVHKAILGRVGRALTLGETFGLAKILYEKSSGKVAGFHVLAPHAAEMLPEVSLAIQEGLGIEDIWRVIHPHPTMSEFVWESVDGAVRRSG